jgi:hypothetical protein
MHVYGYLLMSSDLLLILCGATMYWFSPRLNRNWLFGYGSPRSMVMVNDNTWQAANRFAGLSLSLLALIMMSVHVTLWPVLDGSDEARTVLVALVLSVPFIVMLLTEKYLSRVFKN